MRFECKSDRAESYLIHIHQYHRRAELSKSQFGTFKQQRLNFAQDLAVEGAPSGRQGGVSTANTRVCIRDGTETDSIDLGELARSDRQNERPPQRAPAVFRKKVRRGGMLMVAVEG